MCLAPVCVCVYALRILYGQDFALCSYFNCYYVCVCVFVCVYAFRIVYGQDFALCSYFNCYYVCVWVLQKMVQVLAIANTARRFPLGGQKASRQDRPFYLHSCCKLSSTRTHPHMLVYHLTLNHMYISMYAKLSLCVHAHMPLHTHVCIQVSMHTLVTLGISLPPPPPPPL